jgi:hypothetical protein
MSDNEEIQNHTEKPKEFIKNKLLCLDISLDKSQPLSNDIKNLNQKYQIIIDNYKLYNDNIKNVNEDIKKLESIHHIYINSADMSSLNYSVYVDDIKHQINITRLEYDYINNVYIMNIEKLYRDLFKLYNRLTKLLLIIFKDNRDIIIKIWKSSEKINYESHDFKKLKKSIKTLSDNSRSNNPLTNDNRIFDEIKKQFYYDLKIYNELEDNKGFDLNDIVKINSYLAKRIEDLYLSRELIQINLLDIQTKTEKGLLGQTFVMDLNGKSDRIKVDYNIMIKLYESILDIHLTLAKKYNDKSHEIAEQVNYDEDTNELIESDNISNDIFFHKHK